jgi:molybdopterin-guanine dinucleotide biosynthesis protein A
MSADLVSRAGSGITGAILAGGRARRMGGQDKGLLSVDGRPMISYVIRALRPQVSELLINANRHLDAYEALCACPVVSDSLEGFAGPLAGMAAALQHATHDLVLIVPCDAPLIGADLAERLADPVRAARADIAVATDGERMQPVFALLRRGLLESLVAFLEGGGRKIDRWYPQHRVEEVAFSRQAEMFANINTPEDVRDVERRLRRSA